MTSTAHHVVLGGTGVVGRETVAPCGPWIVTWSPCRDPAVRQPAREHGLTFTVGRSADFYGPGASTSVFNAFVIDKARSGKEPSWLLDAHQPHPMTYTPDVGKALALLGTDPRARGKVWHLPIAPPLTGDEYMAIATKGSLRHRTMSSTTMSLGALFNRAAREALEMSYQNTRPYIFDSTLFERTFAASPTPYAEGIQAALEHAAPDPDDSRISDLPE